MTSARAWAAAVRRVLRERAGIDVVAMTPTRSGESGATFWITDRSGAVMPGDDGASKAPRRPARVTL